MSSTITPTPYIKLIGKRFFLARGADQVATVPVIRSIVGITRIIAAFFFLILSRLGEVLNNALKLEEFKGKFHYLVMRSKDELFLGITEMLTLLPQEGAMNLCAKDYIWGNYWTLTYSNDNVLKGVS